MNTSTPEEEVSMKNVFAFVAGGVVALAGVILGSGVKAATVKEVAPTKK